MRLLRLSRIQISNNVVGYCWRVVKPFIAVIELYSSGVLCYGECLILGGHGCAWALLWLGHAPSISHAIGPRHPSY